MAKLDSVTLNTRAGDEIENNKMKANRNFIDIRINHKRLASQWAFGLFTDRFYFLFVGALCSNKFKIMELTSPGSNSTNFSTYFF